MIVLCEGMASAMPKRLAMKISDKTRWPIYDYPYKMLDSERYGVERDEFDKRKRILQFMKDTDTHDVILCDFYFDMVVRGIVDAGWYAMSAIRDAEKLSDELSAIGAVLIHCRENGALKTAEKRSDEQEAIYRVKSSLHDLLYTEYTGEKRTSSILEFDHTIYNLKLGR